MHKQLVLLLLILVISQVCLSQPIDSVNIKNSKKTIDRYFGQRLDESSYLLYSLDNKYIVIHKTGNSFKLYYLTKDNGMEDSILYKRKRVLKRAFDLSSYKKGFFDSNSDTIFNYRHPHSNLIYFVFKDQGRMICEFNLPAMFSIDVKGKHIYPLDDKVHGFLIKKYSGRWK